MQIHVVAQGQSLWGISQLYGIPWQRIVDINGLEQPGQLAVGQTLLIPTQNRYTVQQGDSFFSIARKTGVTVQELQSANPQLQGSVLYPGQVLRIPERAKTPTIVNAYAEPYEETIANARDAAKALSWLAVFSYHVDAQGNLRQLENDDRLLQVAKSTGVRPILTITNIKEGADFSTELATTILSSQQIQTTLINNILTLMQQKGYTGVNVDFEFLGAENRERYNQFLRRLVQRMRPQGYIVSTAVAPKTSATQEGVLYEGHDYKAHGQIVDYVIIMTYEWGWSGGPPMPVSPLPEVERVLRYAISEIPKEKVMMGVNLYGYDWTLPFVEGGEFAKALSIPQATRLAYTQRTEIQYNQEDEAPFYTYYDQNGKEHIVWFEDLRSYAAKFELLKRLGIAGMSFWNLAFSYPPLWVLLQDRFQIKK
ncbi:LysM peptidoglycan-binding domain-containing protein [Alkalihalobacillus sp. AL-G]|uniref:LysM peptidoglycan-binding domain-containing protein n=1 Tax=Alkalihalobacillus sp. AL-G TaxID=2926399 RepID=UPI00272B6D06|nr:LysM peptidoglycan-binding domain-containing protein [Alkalihalobacillus sp. AL-G]WLD91788.1 LysM peptidoglycan-binding domain-containing protein [Alkalihalobacillus sp. AL-G]